MKSIFDDLSLIRKTSPLVHNITNYVAMPTVANILLALGASPLMAHAPQELADLSNITKALVLNIGTLDFGWVSSMIRAQQIASKRSIPIILDPVGAGASSYRTNTALNLLKTGVTILRGNATEIMALANNTVVTKGVDTTCDSLAAKEAAIYLAKKYSCVVAVSGATDFITDAKKQCCIRKSLTSFFTKVTAMGCAATGVIGAFASVNSNPFDAAIHAMATFGIAGEIAMKKSYRPGDFYSNLLNALFRLTKNDFAQELVGIESNKIIDYSLYLIADCGLCKLDKLMQIVSKTARNGVTCVQLRGKALSQQQLVKVGKRLQKILNPLNIPLIINDSIEVAKQLNADGIHLGQSDDKVPLARKLLGSDKIIGLSIENSKQAIKCKDLDVDYFGVGPIFSSMTKSDASSPINNVGLKIIKSILNSKPIVAIGGINVDNAVPILQCNPAGIAVASAIISAKNPIANTRTFRNIIHKNKDRLSYHTVLVIAGSDSSGGAGVQADIKTVAATGGYAATVITALTAQNTVKVSAIYDVSAKFVGKQLTCVLDDIDFSATKIGMLFRADIIEMVATKLQTSKINQIVLDPVMVAKNGDKLINGDAILSLQKLLFPLAFLITPNIPEAEMLLRTRINSVGQMKIAAKRLAEKHQTNILIKGGHLSKSKNCTDVLYCYDQRKILLFSSARLSSKNTHGTGCTLSSAIASYLAQGNSLADSITKAKEYLAGAIRRGERYAFGHGNGPVNHFA